MWLWGLRAVAPFFYGVPQSLQGTGMNLLKWSCCVAILSLAGCGGGGGDGNRVPVFKVTGKVTMGGGPVADAVVTFAPREKQPVAIGRTDTEGNYLLTTYSAGDGAAAGEFGVMVMKEAPAASGSSGPPAHGAGFAPPAHASQKSGKQQPTTKSTSLLPEKYSHSDKSGLTAKVTADGPNEFNFELKP